MARTSPSARDIDITPGTASSWADGGAGLRITNRSMVLLLLAGALGGAIGAFIADQYYGILPRPEMSEKYYKESEEKWATMDFSDDVVAEMKWADSVVIARNSGLALGIIGAILGGLFGAATGIVLKRPMASARGLLGGVAIGGVCGVTAGFAGAWLLDVFEGFQVEISGPGDLSGAWLRRMYFTILIHAMEWCLVALGVVLSVGLAVGFRTLHLNRMAWLMLVGAVFAAVAYTPLAAGLFAGLHSEIPFPEGTWNRLLFTILPGVGMALMLGLALRNSSA